MHWQVASMLLLFCTGLPFAAPWWAQQLQQSWTWPFATGIVVILWLQREWWAPGSISMRLFATIASIGLAVTISAITSNSHWLAAVAQLVLIFGLLLLSHRVSRNPSWGSAIIPLGLIIGPPPSHLLSMRDEIWNLASQTVSREMTLAGLLHDPGGEVFRTLTGSVDVAATLLNPLSWPLFTTVGLILCTLVGTSAIRQLMLTPILLIAGFGWALKAAVFCGTSLQADVVSVSSFWGFLLWFFPAAVSAFSLSLTVRFLTATVRTNRERVTGPLGVLWNRHITGDISEWEQPLRFRDQQDRLRSPLTLASEFAGSWFYSRSKGLSAWVLPGFIALLWFGNWLRVSGEHFAQQIPRNELALGQLKDGESPDQRRLLLSSILHMNPVRYDIKMKLAELDWQEGHRETAWKTIVDLAESPQSHLPEARFWLARESVTGDPLEKYSQSEINRQVLAGLEERPENIEMRLFLTRAYLSAEETMLAEQQVLKIVEKEPRYALELSTIRQVRGQNIQADGQLQKLLSTLEAELFSNPRDMELRIRVAILQARLNSPEAARKTFDSVPVDQRTPDLKRGLAQLTLAQFEGHRMDGQDTSAALLLLQKVLEADPLGPQTIFTLVQVIGAGGAISIPSADQIDSSTSEALDSPEQVQTSKAVLRYLRDGDAAQLENSLDDAVLPLTRLMALVHLLTVQGKQDVASRIVDRIRADAANLKDSGDRLILEVQLLSAQSLFSEAISLLESRDDIDLEKRELMIANLYHDEFDRLTGYPGGFSPDLISWKPTIPDGMQIGELVIMLRKATVNQHGLRRSIHRLVALQKHDESPTAPAGVLLAQLRSVYNSESNYLQAKGTQLAAQGRYAEAVEFLRLHIKLERRPTAAANNNLAVCLIRMADTENYDEALQLSNKANESMPKNSNLLATRGEIHLVRGELQRALEDLKESVDIDPSNAEGWQYLARTYAEMGNLDQSELAQQQVDRLRRAAQQRQSGQN